MQILVTNTKGGCGKSTLSACLSEVLDADLVDHDPQGTITVNAHLTGRHKPVSYNRTKKKIIVHDTPPYNTANLNSLIKEVDLIIIPTKLMYADLLALATLVDKLEKMKSEKKALLVFNEVRYHNKKLNNEIRQLFVQEYPKIKIANTEIPNWIGYSKVLAMKLQGREQARIQLLVKELNTYKNSIKI